MLNQLELLAAEAQRAFTALCAFDEHASERRELLVSGVSEQQVLALYGRSYPALIPGLMLHIEYAADDELLTPGHLQARQIYNSLLPISEKLFERFMVEDEADMAELLALELGEMLTNCVAERFADLKASNPAAAANNLTGADVAGTVQIAYWLQVNRALLAPEVQVHADELMVALAHTISL